MYAECCFYILSYAEKFNNEFFNSTKFHLSPLQKLFPVVHSKSWGINPAFELKEQFMQYEILYILAMKSQYSIRLYELLKSYEFQSKKTFETEELKVRISAENYERFPDFKRFVFEAGIHEINNLSDITVNYEVIKNGKKYTKIEFSIKQKKKC